MSYDLVIDIIPRKIALLLILVTAIGGASPVYAGENIAIKANQESEQAVRLEALRKKIQHLKSSLNNTRGKQRTLRQQLKLTETEIGRLSLSLQVTNQQLRHQGRELKRLKSRYQVQQKALFQQRKALKQQILTGYSMGRQGYLKIILNQQDPAQIGRTLAYYDYFNRARATQINRINLQLEEISNLEQEISRDTARLKTLSDRQKSQMTEKERHRRQRQEVLVKLDKDILTKSQRLKVFLQDEQNLVKLLTQLQAALSDIPPDAGEDSPFPAFKGRLIWPAKGRVSAHYGARRQNTGKLKWQGVMISAPEGEEVYSVHQGRVAFADWLRGFGLLVIIDHGKGYMSLYAHNQSLYKSVGEWVARGEVIATVGNSGGQAESGLYFEIRNKGKPVNPIKWLQATK